MTDIIVRSVDGSKIARCRVTVTDSDKVGVTGITLSKDELSMSVGEEYQLTATISPSNATNKKLIWESNNASVATVNDGMVKAIKAGSAKITVTAQDGGHWACCQVTVSAKEEPVTRQGRRPL